MGFPILRGLSFTQWGIPLLFSPFRCPESPLSLPVNYHCLQRYFEQPPFLGHQWVMHNSGAAESLAGEGRGFLLWVKKLSPDPSTCPSTTVALYDFLFLETVYFRIGEGLCVCTPIRRIGILGVFYIGISNVFPSV